MDHFKFINDRCGHATGDHVLKEFARLSRETLRPADVLGRWGGEEFLLIMPNADLEVAIATLERLRTRITITRGTGKVKDIHLIRLIALIGAGGLGCHFTPQQQNKTNAHTNTEERVTRSVSVGSQKRVERATDGAVGDGVMSCLASISTR